MSDRTRHAAVTCILPTIIALVVLSNIPLLYGYLNEPPHLKFMGIVAGVRDANVYFMMMSQGDGASPILQNLFCPGEPNAIYHGFFWFLLGKLAYWFGLPDVAMYHAARLAAAIIFVPVMYSFASRFLETTAERTSAMLVACFGAGAGWIMMFWRHGSGTLPFVPVDLGTPEASSFYTHMTFPHLALSLVLMLLCMALVWDAVETKKTSRALLGGICGLLLGFIHAFNLLVIGIALALFAVSSLAVKRDASPLRPVVAFGSIAVWPIAYYVYIQLTRPGLLPPGAVRSPAPIAYLVGFAPLLVGLVVRLAFLLRARRIPRSEMFLMSWVVASSALLYSYPLVAQEARAVLGLQIPLVVLAVRALFLNVLPALGLEWGTEGPRRRSVLAVSVVSFCIALTLPSTVYTVGDRIERLKQFPELFSLTDDECEAMNFLRNTGEHEIVLSSERMGMYIPRLARAWAWSGEYDYPSYDTRQAMIRSFFSELPFIGKHCALLRDHDIDFVFYGNHERLLGPVRPETMQCLIQVFANDSVEIYRTNFDQALESKVEANSVGDSGA